MKNLKFLMIALVAMFGFISCDKHECNDYDHSADLVGTWTCMDEDFAEALVISADGSVVSTRLFKNEYHEDVKGKIVVENGNVNFTFEDGGNFKSHFDIIPGIAFSFLNEEGERLTYNYCANDLADELVGMWVCTDGPTDADNDMMIRNFSNDGKTTFTGLLPIGDDPESILNYEVNYKVVGNLVFLELPENNAVKYNAERLIYSPNATALGDILTIHRYLPTGNGLIESKASFLRIKQNLNLTGKVYDYSSAYVTNAKGKDEDFSITGSTFNIANIKAGDFDMMFRTVLFCVDFPNANTIKQHFRTNGINTGFETPITVDGNKVTLDLSAANPAYRKVDMYMFQDANSSQLHIYMPTSSFINYFANLEIVTLLTEGKIDPTDATAVEKVYTNMEARVESINVSFVLKARK